MPYGVIHLWSLMISTSAASAVSGVLISDQSHCNNKKYTNTTDYITSYDNTYLSLCIGSFCDPFTDKTPVPTVLYDSWG